MLAISQPTASSPLVTLDLPSALSPRVMNALKADPRTIDIRALAPHFYSLGALMLELFEEDELVDVMTDVRSLNESSVSEICFLITQQTFKKRAAEIADQAHNPRGALGEGADFLRGLDESERQCKRSTNSGLFLGDP